MNKITYKDAGVDIEAGHEAVRRIRALCRSTFTPGVLGDIGHFGGLFDLSTAGLRDPVLVASTDGVGTKIQIGAPLGRHADLGRDIVGHSVNDVLVQGARPLFFLDYIGCGKLDPPVVEQLIAGMAEACRADGCALIGGEMAEMPSVYREGDYDLVGTLVGVVERGRLLTGADMVPGDVCFGLPSVSPHTNGFSLIRKLAFEVYSFSPGDRPPELGGETVADALLKPHKSYFREVYPVLEGGGVRALAHITGGGLLDNPPRVLPEGRRLVLHRGSWPVLPVFRWLCGLGGLEETEAHRAFNMGLGMLVIAAADRAREVEERLRSNGATPFRVGEVVAGERGVELA